MDREQIKNRMTHSIKVSEVEFVESSHTLWVHDRSGGTALRIKCTGKITVDDHCTNTGPHSDIMVQGDIHVCWPKKTKTSKVKK